MYNNNKNLNTYVRNNNMYTYYLNSIKCKYAKLN